jgi:hypothetical protein
VGLNGIQTTPERSTPSLASGDAWWLRVSQAASADLGVHPALCCNQQSLWQNSARALRARAGVQRVGATNRASGRVRSITSSVLALGLWPDKQRFRAVQHVRFGWHQEWILRQRMVQRTKLQTEPVQVLRKRASMRAFR